MKHLIRAASVAAALIATAALGHADTLDQNNAPLSYGNANPTAEWQQQVTAGASGLLAGITLYDDSVAPLTETLSIGIGNAFTSTFVISETVTLNAGGDYSLGSTFIDLSTYNILLTAGETFVIDLSNGSGGWNTIIPASYAGGDLYVKVGSNSPVDWTTQHGDSLAFQTYVDPAPTLTPEPSSMILLLTGLSAGAGLLRRRVKA
jgi:hypothetical protein